MEEKITEENRTGEEDREEERRVMSQNNGKSSPVTGLEWLRGFHEVKVPRFHDNGTGWW